MQTAAIKLLGDVLAQPTYRLEGDRFCLPFVFEEVKATMSAIKEFMEEGIIPTKSYDDREMDVLDLDSDVDPTQRDNLVSFLRECGYDRFMATSGDKKGKPAFTRHTLGPFPSSSSPFSFPPCSPTLFLCSSQVIRGSLRDDMSAILSTAQVYFNKRFGGEGETMAEERFTQLLDLAKVANLLRLRDETEASATAALATLPATIALPSLKQKFLEEWKAARLQQSAQPTYYKEPVPSSQQGHVRQNGEYCYSWWQAKKAEFPTVAQVARKLVLLQPTSAAVERVFSIFNHLHLSTSNMLMDIKRASVMIPYNERMRTTPPVKVVLL